MLTFYQMVGQRIYEVLLEKGWTQQQLADSIGISKQVMSKILNGDKNTTILEIREIADVLEVPVQQLLAPMEANQVHLIAEEYVPEIHQEPLFMGQVTTEAGMAGLKRAFGIIEMILDCEESFANSLTKREQKVDLSGIRKMKTFRPTSIQS